MHYWTATHPDWEGSVSAYAIDDGARPVLVDPIALPDDVRALFESRDVVTVLTSTWHERDAASPGFPVWAPAPDRPEDQLVPATRYAIGDTVFGMEAYPGREGQLDLVLWHEGIRAVIAGDTLIDLGNGLEIPASWLPDGVMAEQVAAGLRPLQDEPVELVLPTHGPPPPASAPRSRRTSSRPCPSRPPPRSSSRRARSSSARRAWSAGPRRPLPRPVPFGPGHSALS